MATRAAASPAAAAGRLYRRKTAPRAAAPAAPAAPASAQAPAQKPRGGGAAAASARFQEVNLVAGASFLLLVVFVLTGILTRRLLLESWMRPQRFSQSGADVWVLEQNDGRPGYFIDIGAVQHSDLSNTRLLEQHGWQGVCVDPDTRTIQDRECGWVTRPITSRGGERVDLPACRNHTCSDGKATSISVEYLLALLEPSPVIDYISISARSQGLDIIQGFPWDQHCVRFWTVEHANEDQFQESLWQLLGGKGCRMATGVADFFAACACDSWQGGAAAAQATAGRPGARAGGPLQLAPDMEEAPAAAAAAAASA